MNPATKQYLKEHGPVKLIALYRAFANSYPALRHAALKQARRFEKLTLNRHQKVLSRCKLV